MGKCTIFCFSPGNFYVGQIGPPLNFFVGHLEFERAMARDLAQKKNIAKRYFPTRKNRDPLLSWKERNKKERNQKYG